ncbi:MAG: hypothetical protein NXI32_24440, partial [bacterium]|nr:hypothetical protein [bacterium]
MPDALRLIFVVCMLAISSGYLWGRGPVEPDEFAQLNLTVVVSRDYQPGQGPPSLLIHFHGAPATTAGNFLQAKPSDVLVTVNCRGLSSAYRKPFENRQLFAYLLEHVRRQLAAEGHFATDTPWKRIDVSCFSAGYGAVREILKDPQSVQQIRAVVAADSIYASIQIDRDRRRVDATQMEPFLEFARRAMANEKSFIISHSQLPVEAYASTVETAEYLLEQTGITRMPLGTQVDASFSPVSVAQSGSFKVWSFPGDDGESHLKHLRNIAVLWSDLK